MLEWREYISQLLESSTSFDGINLSFDGKRDALAVPLLNTQNSVSIPPIIKASILMLDRMQEKQGKLNILVFPERLQSIFIFTLVKLIYNITTGKIDHTYDPNAFHSGDRLSLGKAVVEYVGIEKHDGKEYMRIKLADLEYSAPIDLFPYFQKTKAKRINRFQLYKEAENEVNRRLEGISNSKKLLQLLDQYRTHMDSSIVNMTTMISAKEMINSCNLCGERANSLFLIGQADYKGDVQNIGVGQLEGTPAIVLVPDLYSVAEMAQKGHPIQSIIVDSSNSNSLNTQLDKLDELVRLGVPITCVTDVVNSFDLKPLLERGFNLWRWDETSLTDQLYNTTPLSLDQKTKHCAKRKVDYLISDGNEISTAIRLLYALRKETQSASAQVLKLFDKLFSVALAALRETVPLVDSQCAQVNEILSECSVLLSGEKNFVSDKTYTDYETIIRCLKTVYTSGFVFPKHEALASRLRSGRSRRVALVIPEKSDKSKVQSYWQKWCTDNGISTVIETLYPSEYYLLPCGSCDATIVVGWLKRAIMRKTLYGFNTQFYTVLLYDYEKRWKNYDTAKWNSALDNAANRKTIEQAFSTDRLRVSTKRFAPFPVTPAEHPKEDEFNEIETILRENKYRQYIASGGQSSKEETTEAIPVNYVGGYLAFYRTGHKVISASNIIEHDEDNIEAKFPRELKLGEFIVVRETDRDLVKEIADVILERAGQSDLREIATKWKEALEIETLFYSPEEIYERLQAVGCTRGYATIRSWLTDEEKIAPQSKEDLEHIAAITESDVMKEMLDQIYAAARIVKAAHTRAGVELSQQLKKRVVQALKEYGDIDPFNIWEPIEMQVDGVGLVRILKIIDIGSPVIVDVADTNRLIDE